MTLLAWPLLFLSWVPLVAGAQTRAVVRQADVVLRAGPGSYYPVLAELHLGLSLAIQDSTDGWLQVRAGALDGYVSRRAVAESGPAPGVPPDTAALWDGLTVCRHGVPAGIRRSAGFCATRLSASPELLLALLESRADAQAQEGFRRDTYGTADVGAMRRSVPLPARVDTPYYTFAEQGLGLAIAARIAAQGLYLDPVITAYVERVGQLLVEASDVYDISFRFLVLDHPQPTAVSCPGGVVFVSAGMLRAAQTEAELACVLGHQIAHISRYHGMPELDKSRAQAASAGDSSETDDAAVLADEPRSRPEEGLDELALILHERLTGGSAAEHEVEADWLGMVFAARAGYQPAALAELLARLETTPALAAAGHYAPEQIHRRLAEARRAARRLPGGLMDGTERYQRATVGL